MKTAVAAESKAVLFDFKKSLLEAFAVNEKANQFLRSNIDGKAWQAPPPSGKRRSIADIALHIHHVRLMWLTATDKSTCARVQSALKASAAIQALLTAALLDRCGPVPSFKPDVVHFIAYLIAQDCHHRGQIAMLARQVGYSIPAKAGFGLWEWSMLWRACGFGK